MAATTCAYGCPPSAPAPAVMARSLQAFSHQSHGDDMLGSVIHSVVIPPPPAPPPPPLPPPLLALHSGARTSHTGSISKAASRRDPGLCTEGLGSESSGDVDLGDTTQDMEAEQALHCERQHSDEQEATAVPARARGRRAFPPPISVIGAAGKPWQYLRAHRGDGRLVLREVRIPSRELLQACREDGRLKLHFAHPDQENNY